jgi:hypothetical protein
MRRERKNRRSRGLAALVVLTATLITPAGHASWDGSRLVDDDGFDVGVPATLPVRWHEVGASGYRALPDLDARSSPFVLRPLLPGVDSSLRGASWDVAPLAHALARVDVRLISVPTVLSGAGVAVRATDDLRTGYFARLTPTQLVLERRSGGAAQRLGAASFTPGEAWHRVSVEAIGAVIVASVGNVRVVASDPSPLAAGTVGLFDDGAVAAFDDVALLDPLSADIDITPVAADGVAHPITVTLFDQGTPARGRAVSLLSDRGVATDTVSPSSATTDAAGRATFTIKTSTPGAPMLSVHLDGMTTSAARRVLVTGNAPAPLYRTTFDSPLGGLPSGWSVDGNFAITDAAVLLDRSSPVSTTQRDVATYRGTTYADSTVEAHAVMPSTVTHPMQTFGVAARASADGKAMYLLLAKLDTPRKSNDAMHELVLIRRSAGTDKVLASLSTLTTRLDSQTRLKLQVTGSAPVTVRAKTWAAHDPEPAGWDLEAADGAGAVTAAGYAGVVVQGGGGPWFDNFTVSAASDGVRTDVLAHAGNPLNAFTVVVNPVRGPDFATGSNSLRNLPGSYEDGMTAAQHLDASRQQAATLDRFDVTGSWLARYDAVVDPSFRDFLRSRPQRDELGLYLEVTPVLASAAGVTYHSRSGGRWYDANALFVTGYTSPERKKLIDAAMAVFQASFGRKPATVGAFWIDAWSLQYMRDTYGVTNAMTVSENLCTDGFTEWGGYFNHPYYPTTSHARMPASAVADKLDVVVWPWSVLDPLMGYRSVFYAALANNYTSRTGLSCNAAANVGSDYYAQQIDLATDSTANGYGWFMGGLENAYPWGTYGVEYTREIESIASRAENGWLQVVTTEAFASWYRARYPALSPAQSIVERVDWSGGDDNVLWFYSPRYRARVVWSPDHLVIEDVRAYDDKVAEPYLYNALGSPKFDFTLPGLLDVRRHGTILRGVAGSVDERSSANVRNVVVTRSVGHAQIAFDSDAGHTVISFGTDGFTIDARPAAGSFAESIRMPSGGADWQGLLRSATKSIPAADVPLALTPASLSGVLESVWLGTAVDGPRGGAAFINSSVSGGTVSAVMNAGTGALEQIALSYSGSASGQLVTIVAPATASNWEARLALARSAPAQFR